MAYPRLQVRRLVGGCHVIDDDAGTVALVTPQGYIDWLRRSPEQPGTYVNEVRKETHLGNVRGLKLLVHLPHFCEEMTGLRVQAQEDQRQALVVGEAVDADGAFRSHTEARLALGANDEYAWELVTTFTCLAAEPVNRTWVEYNNIYPHGTGRCLLFAPDKRYSFTAMEDAAGRVWEFPHQHTLHYTAKINTLDFAEGTRAGFCGEQDGAPVCEVRQATLPPDWAICDMYYDLHCGLRPQGAFQRGHQHEIRYRVRYLSPEEERRWVSRAEPIPVSAEDRAKLAHPRLELGLNHFAEPVAIDRLDDASCFRQLPPKLTWAREEGGHGRGALKLWHDTPQESVWSATPPTQIPASTEFRLGALVKTERIKGRGVYLRVRYHTYEWYPTPHVDWAETLCSPPLTGTRDWTRILVPTLDVPPEHDDYLIWIDVVFEGSGTAWVTDMDVDLVRADVTADLLV